MTVAGAPAAAFQFDFELLPLSEIVPESGPAQPLTGSFSIDLESFPPPNAVMNLIDVSVQAGALSIRLDPTLSTPGLGVLRDDGTFLIPTLFLRIDDGVAPFDLAVPNVGGAWLGTLETRFQIDSGGPAGVLTVVIIAAVPEPATALLLGLGIAALVGARRREIAR